jgi:putative DNA methylase
MIDRWFPVSAVDEACRTPAGSGRVEKAVFSWFASRPIAQARAAVLTALLPSNARYKGIIESAIRDGRTDDMNLARSEVT